MLEVLVAEILGVKVKLLSGHGLERPGCFVVSFRSLS